MKQHHVKAIIITALVVLIGWLLYLYINKKKEIQKPIELGPRETKEIYNYDRKKCPGEPIEFTVKDPYMRGVVEENQKVKVVMNYYSCNSLKDGDVVLYKYSQYEEPVIRRVVGVPGDSFKLKSVEHEGWELYVNDKVVTGAKGQPYRFGVDKYAPPLELAARQRKNVLPEKELIVFSSFPPGDRDSGIFGLANQDDIVGKVEVRASTEEKQ